MSGILLNFYRFRDSKDEQRDAEEPVTEAMDLFSVGCIIAQLFMEGDILFTFSDLLAYAHVFIFFTQMPLK